MLNFVCHYKVTTHFSSDELGKNSSTYDVLEIVHNYLTFKSMIRNEKTNIFTQQHTHYYKLTLKSVLLNLGSSIYIYVDFIGVHQLVHYISVNISYCTHMEHIKLGCSVYSLSSASSSSSSSSSSMSMLISSGFTTRDVSVPSVS